MQLRAIAFSLALVATPFTVAAQGADASVDDEGTVAAATQELQGRSNAANSSACASCATAGAPSEVPPLAVAGAVFALGAVARRRRRD